MSDDTPAYITLLRSTPIADAATPNAPDDIVTVDDETSLQDALSTLAANGVLSAPVVSSTGAPLGLLDCLDAMAALVKRTNEADEARDLNTAFSTSPRNVEAYLERPDEYWMAMAGKLALSITNAHEAIDISERNPFVAVKASTNPSLLTLAKQFARGLHRVAVTDDDGSILQIISQSAIINFLADNIDSLGDAGAKTLAECGFVTGRPGFNAVVLVAGHISALDAFRLMHARSVSALAIVDDEGRLFGVVSATDLKGLTADTMKRLNMPLMEFLDEIRSDSDLPATFSVSLTGDNTVADVVATLAEHAIHRVFVTKNKKPVGVVSLTDVLDVLLEDLE